jgi:hypothetical protein
MLFEECAGTGVAALPTSADVLLLVGVFVRAASFGLLGGLPGRRFVLGLLDLESSALFSSG